MIRILHTIDTTGPGGAETVFINLIKQLDPKKYQSVVAIRGPGWVNEMLRESGIEPIFVPSKGGFNLRYLWKLIKIIRENEINVIQAHLLGSNLYGSLAGIICRVPVVSTFHGFVDASENDRLISIKSWIINKGSIKVVFVSDRLRIYYMNKYGFSSKKSVTVYNGVDISLLKPKKSNVIRKELSIGPNNILIGALGNIRPAKGYGDFLKAASFVYNYYPDSRFVIVGEGSGLLHENLLKIRKQLKLEDVFFFLGFREEPAVILNNFDIFVLPSISEGFSIATIEAMACGLPVIVTKSGGPEEIITDQVDGLLANVSDERCLAECMKLIISDSIIRGKLTTNARTSVKRRFSALKMTEKYERIYQSLNLT